MIKKLVTYSLVFITLSYALQWIVYNGLQQNNKGIYEKLNTIFYKENNYNTLMLGSSRMFMHLDNNLFDSLTHLNSYNLGLAGATPQISYSCLKAYLLNSKMPKTIFWEFDYHIAHLNTDTIFNFSTYFPYLGNKVLYQKFKHIDNRFFLFKNCPLIALPYININGLSASVNGWLGRNGPYDGFFKNGFFYNYIPDSNNNFTSKDNATTMSAETLNYLDSCINFCKQNTIQLVFTISPILKETDSKITNKSSILNQFMSIAQKHQVPVLNHSEDPDIANNSAYFEDGFHMLYPGAQKYTLKIVQEFNNITP